MFGGLALLGCLMDGVRAIKEWRTPRLSAEHWNNDDLLTEDKLDPNVTPEQIMKNAAAGKYYSKTYIPHNIAKQDYTSYDPRKWIDYRIKDRDVYLYDCSIFDFDNGSEREKETGRNLLYHRIKMEYYGRMLDPVDTHESLKKNKIGWIEHPEKKFPKYLVAPIGFKNY